MIPDTRSGLPAMACVSAMQKSIRRGMEREAMEFACELIHTSKAFHSMVCNRLEVICHEDLDTLAAPHVFPFVAASLAASRDRYSKSIGEARLMVANAIRMMARAPKSRAGCHFGAAIGLRSSLEDFAPTIPDWPTISTRWPVASLAVVSIIFGRKVRSLYRRRQNPTCLSRKPTGSGRSSSRASDGAGRSRGERTQALCAGSCGATIGPVLDGNRK
jgi:hypothetical protein